MAGADRPAVKDGSERHSTGAAVRGKEPLVLIVDDVDDNRDLYALYFTHAGFSVEQAQNGDEALVSIRERRPDAVIMDLAMPGLDGWETTRRLKSSPATKDILVIVVTGHATRLGLERAKDAGADAVCTKPCLPADLCALVKKHLAERIAK